MPDTPPKKRQMYEVSKAKERGISYTPKAKPASTKRKSKPKRKRKKKR